jgi:C-terminal processing protease CtpA/Prc
MRWALIGLLLTALGAWAAGEPAVPELIEQLGAPEFARRQAAQEQLIARANTELDPLLEQGVASYARATDPEVKIRLRDVLQAVVMQHIIDRPRGFLGVRFNRNLIILNGQPEPVVGSVEIMSITPGSAADKAGLQAGDRMLQIGELDLRQEGAADKFVPFIQSKPPGAPLHLVIDRAGEQKQIDLKLGELPEEIKAEILTEQQKAEQFQQWLDDQLAKTRAGGAK